MALAYVAVMLLIARPVLSRVSAWIDSKGRVTQGILAIVLLCILSSSLATESIGIHSVFGAFLLGAIIPSTGSLARELTSKLEDFVVVFLLPAFFAFTGLRTQIGLVSGFRNWMFCVLIILVASLGKFGGSSIAARLNGMKWRDASALGVLMNTRGLMELIVLNIGLELHVISPTLFAMLVLMALVTTCATSPILHYIIPPGELEGEAKAIDEASRISLAVSERSGVLIAVSSTTGVDELLDLALQLTPAAIPPPRVLPLARTSVVSVGSKVEEAEMFSLYRSPILTAALDAAWRRKVSITPEAVWTADVATEIVEVAERSQIRWLLLESRRSMFGRSPQQGLINRIMQKAAAYPVNVAVVLQPSLLRQGPVTCIVGRSVDSFATLDLTHRLAQGSKRTFRTLVISPESTSSEETLESSMEWVRRLAPDATPEPISLIGNESLAAQTRDDVIVIAKDVVANWHIAFEELTGKRSVILVQGAGNAVHQLDPLQVGLSALPVNAT
jgi:hypothetical protein